jgi:hypothetical protein
LNELPDLSKAYAAVRRFAEGAFHDELRDDLEASARLLEHCHRFEEKLTALDAAIESANKNEIAGAFIKLRIATMNVMSDFDNLTDAIERLFSDGFVGMESSPEI